MSTHNCTEEDKEKFLVNLNYDYDFFNDENKAATFKDF